MLARFKASRFAMAGLVVAFVAVGYAMLTLSRAATSGSSFEAENGELVNAIAFADDPGASGISAVSIGGQPTTATPTPTAEPTPIPDMPGQIPLDQLPKGNPGSAKALIVSGAPSGAPTATWASAFRIECGFSHMSYDDPIVYPGQVGKAHLHTFFGNGGTNYTSTYQTLKNSGNSTCSGGILNRSAYWVPTIIQNNVPVAPKKAVVYYKSGYPSVPFATIQKLPDGLVMITGSASSSSSQNTGLTFVEWYCGSGGGRTASIPTCSAGDELILGIDFPQCWDGVNLDAPDHKAHMAMPQDWSSDGCPSTHPVPLPHITMLVHWPVSSGNTAGWRLSSDMYGTDKPGGFSAHADYMEGWDKDVKDTFVTQCLQVGKDCQVRRLGDGRSLQNVPDVN